MSLTANELSTHVNWTDRYTSHIDLASINPALNPHRHNILGRLESYLSTAERQPPIWGVCNGLWVTVGGYYDHDSRARDNYHDDQQCWPIELILSVRPAPATSHSNWNET